LVGKFHFYIGFFSSCRVALALSSGHGIFDLKKIYRLGVKTFTDVSDDSLALDLTRICPRASAAVAAFMKAQADPYWLQNSFADFGLLPSSGLRNLVSTVKWIRERSSDLFPGS